MRFTRFAAVLLAAAVLGYFGLPGVAQSGNVFKGRLSKVPVDAKMVPIILGTGTATATLSGTRATIAGTFEGMGTPATVARLYQSKMTGMRGKSMSELTVTKAASGSLSGTVNLAPDQVESLRKGRLYIQIDSDKGPEGHLWGWLLP
jgi:hypothetical protein